MFSLLRRFIEFVRQLQNEQEKNLNSLLWNALWSVSTYIDITTDILGWINGNIEELLNDGAVEVNVIIGESFADFIINSHKYSNCIELSHMVIEAFRGGVILVAMDEKGKILKEQLIRSSKGLSEDAIILFNGAAMLKIKIPS